MSNCIAAGLKIRKFGLFLNSAIALIKSPKIMGIFMLIKATTSAAYIKESTIK